MRYFAKLGANNEAINIYRFNVGETDITEQRWDSRSSSWVDNPDADVVRYLTQGEGDFQEVVEDVAVKIFPEAFKDITKALSPVSSILSFNLLYLCSIPDRKSTRLNSSHRL